MNRIHPSRHFQHDAAKRMFVQLAELLPWPSPEYAALVACTHAAWLPFIPADFVESTPSARAADTRASVDDTRTPSPDISFIDALLPWAHDVHARGTPAQRTLLEELGLVAIEPGEELWVRSLHTHDALDLDDDSSLDEEPSAFLPVLMFPSLREAIVLLEAVARRHAPRTVARTGFEFAVRTLRWASAHVGDELFGAFVHDVTPTTPWTLLGRTHAGDA